MKIAKIKPGFIISVMIFVLLTGCGQESATNGDSGRIVLKMACWVSDLEVQTLVNDYNASQDTYEIEIVSYFESGQNVDSALDRMNIELATNNDIDLYYLDSMDTMRLSNAGLFADLNTYMSQDSSFDVNAYYWNIWSLFEKNGCLYEFVPNFQIVGIVGPTGVLDEDMALSIDTYESVSTENNFVIRSSSEDILSYMIQYSLSDFVDIEHATCNFITEDFYSWMNFVASFSQASDSETEVKIRSIDGIYDYANYKEEFSARPCCIGIPGITAKSPSAKALCSFAISSGTDYGEACWDFCKMLLSDEYQAGMFRSFGFPMSKAVLEDQLNSAMLATTDENSLFYQMTSSYGTEFSPFTDEDISYILNLIDSIQCVRMRYDQVYDIITEDMAKFLSGDAAAEETAAVIQSRIEIFLSERK